MHEMKYSGIEWIGEIPKDWKLKRIQFCLNEINEKNIPIKTRQVLSLVKDKGVMLYEDKGNQGNKAKEDISQYKIAYPNTLIINSMNILIGSVGISNYLGCVSPVYYVFKENEYSDLRYINYIFNTREFQKELRKYANGILEIRLRVSSYDIFKRKIPLPNKTTQEKIANFLDMKCSEIDKLHLKIEKQIEILTEYKKAIITKAVTKGLNSNNEMKDSKNQWIGKIPIHWDIYKYKHLAYLVRGGSPRPAGNPIYYYGNIPFMKISDITKDDKMYVDSCEGSIKPAGLSNTRMVKKGTLLLTNSGATLGIPKILNINSTINDGIAAFLNIDDKLDTKFAYYSLKSKTDYFLQVAALGMGQPNLNTEIIGNTYVAIPPKYEQQEIIKYLEKKCTEIDSAIEDKKMQMQTLEQYKKSLIYEYVTGKKEVR